MFWSRLPLRVLVALAGAFLCLPLSRPYWFYAGFDYSFWENCRRAALASLLISPQIIRSASDTAEV